MADFYRALVIGCGNIGSRFDEAGSGIIRSHAGAYVKDGRIKLAGLCDLNYTRAKEAAAFWKVDGAFHDPIEALDVVRPNIVSICTPDETHAELLEQVLKFASVQAVLAEKPIADSGRAARRVAELARAQSKALVVNYSRRFHSAYIRARTELLSGRIGPIRSVTGYYSRGIKHNGTHWIDLVRWMVGEIVAVRSDQGVVEWERDPTPDVRFIFESGAVGYLKGLDQRNFALFEVDILGVHGRLRITQGPRFVWSVSRPSEADPSFRYLHDELVSPDPQVSSIALAVANVCDCLEKKATPLCSANDAIRALEIAEACTRSLQTGEEERV